jgi:hypothetical protein
MSKENSNKGNLATWASIAGIIGVCIAAIALIPAFGSWLSPKESPQYVAPSDSGSPNTNTQILTSFPSVPNNPPVTFFNEWVNIDSQSEDLIRVSIQAKDGGTFINMYGACSPTDCNFREYSPAPVVNYNYDPETEVLNVEWIFDFEIMTQELTITPDGQLKVTSHEHFIDNSGRLDYDSVSYFTRQ